MALRTTYTLAICLAGGLAAGIALARPPAASTTAAVAPVATVAAPLADAADDVPAPAPADLTIADFAFSPLTVAPGQTITVTNVDSAPHTATSTDGLFDTGTLAGNTSASLVAPSVPGTYALFCAIHPSMESVIVVS